MTTALALAILMSAPPVHYEGLGAYHRPVSSSSVEAQRYFDEGLAFLYGFNKGQARLNFLEAARLDPNCVMAYWGVAMADGPDINNPYVGPNEAKEAVECLAKAEDAKPTGAEKELIQAAKARFQSPPPKDRAPLNAAFASRMRAVWQHFPKDPDVGAVFAESMMDLHPWALWHRDATPEEGTLEVLDTLRSVLKRSPKHPLALHMFIHATEGGPHPEWAEESANMLLHLQPGISHMVHMPSHTYVRVGRWQDAIDSNTAAIKANLVGHAKYGDLGLNDPYGRHNQEMLAYAAMMTGQRKLAVTAIDRMFTSYSGEKLATMAAEVDGYTPMTLEVRVRFGMWDEILATPETAESYPIARAVRHYARGLAFAAKGDIQSAVSEQTEFESASKEANAGEVGLNSGKSIMEICRHMLAGEIQLAKGEMGEAVRELTAAVEAEDNLNYDEPPDWIMPTRHALGAVLVKAGRYKDAEAIYRSDLQKLPNNGWSLYGLAKALQGQKKAAESKAQLAKFHKTWARSDTPIVSSCMCVK